MTSKIQNFPSPVIRQICGFLEKSEIIESTRVCKKWNKDNDELIARTLRDEILPSFSLPSPKIPKDTTALSTAKVALKEELACVRNRITAWFPSKIRADVLNGTKCCLTTFKNRMFIALGPKIEVRDTRTNEVVKTIEADKQVSHFTHMEALDSRYLAVACKRKADPENMLYVVDMEENKLKSQFEGYVTAMKVHKGILYFGIQKGDVYSLDKETPSRRSTLFSHYKGQSNAVHSIGASEERIVISREVGPAGVYDRKSRIRITHIPNAGTIDEIFHIRAERFAWGNIGNGVYVQDLFQKAKPEFQLLPRRKMDAKAKVNSLTGRHLFACFGEFLFTLNTNALRIYNMEKRTHLQTIKIEGRKEMRFTDGKLYILSQKTGENSQLFTYDFTSR